MIKPNELRVGNLLIHKGNTVVVDGIDNEIDTHFGTWLIWVKDVGLSYPIADFQPIPLDSGWMKRFGFVTMDYELDLIDWARHDTERLFSVSQNGMPVEDQPFLYEYENGYGEDIAVEVKYVHQLQNLYFALTGEELQIIKP